MKISKIAALLLILAISLGACERDDICIEDTTPQLIIRFYDKDDPERLKAVQNLTVMIQGIDGELENETITSSTDSIAIPIRVDENTTRYLMSIPGETTEDPANEDLLELTYSQEDQFVSRSCGYKAIFLDARSSLVTDDGNWIDQVINSTSPLDITNENQAHVKIYH